VSFERLEQEWLSLAVRGDERDAGLVQQWESTFAALVTEKVARSQDWLAGPRTLLAAMNTQDAEVRLTAAVAWLLRPDGHHRLGETFLRRFLARFGVEADLSQPVDVQTEETIGDTRADLLVRVPGATLLVESKVHANEGEEQLDRLAENWRGESPTLIFLTRTVREPVTAVASRGQWRPWLWADVADDVRACLQAGARGSAGVQELLETLETYHRGEGGVVTDAKTEFYFKHRRQIEEWAALRSDARQVLEHALRGLAERASEVLGPDVTVLGEQLDGGTWPHISALDSSWSKRGCLVKVAVAWNRSQLLSATGSNWPYVGIHLDAKQPRAQALRQAVRAEAGEAARQLGWTSNDSYWPYYGYVKPRTEVVQPDELAEDCLLALQAGWQRLAPLLEVAVTSVGGQPSG
jgi:hypothetical protein